MGCGLSKDDTPRVPSATSCDLVPRQVLTVISENLDYGGLVSPYSTAAVEPSPTMAGTETTKSAGRVRVVPHSLKEAGVLSSTEGVICIGKMPDTCTDIVRVKTHQRFHARQQVHPPSLRRESEGFGEQTGSLYFSFFGGDSCSRFCRRSPSP